MFKKDNSDELSQLSTDLQEQIQWHPGVLQVMQYALDVSAMAFDPLAGLLAYGTTKGHILVLGHPGVDTHLELPESGVGVKFLQFSVNTFKLVCLDDQDKLHLWDLSAYGQPKYLTFAKFAPTNFITLSPSHSHVFLALQSGEVETYDLECMRKSSYTVPNMWKLYQEKLALSGLTEGGSSLSATLVETVIHPRDINLLFVAYAGGVILSDLTQRNTLRVFELDLPPGAPGGAGYGVPNILTHRRPEVTSLAVHPAGHFFVVGYADGAFAFWAVEDEDQPLLVRTLDAMNVNIVDGAELEAYMAKPPGPPTAGREPVFKMSWSAFPNSSDPRGGETALTILGGLDMDEAPGVSSMWLPAFNPLDPPEGTDSTRTSLHPFLRSAMRESLTPSNSYFYYTKGIAQDFLLLPRENPHFGGSFDPTAILILEESVGHARVVEAHEFPPPSFLIPVGDAPDSAGLLSPDALTLKELSSTLKDLRSTADPKPLRLHASLWDACTGLLGGQLIKMEREPYDRMIALHVDDPILPLKGGLAWTEEKKASEYKMSKYQPSRVCITHHRDQTIHFKDASAHLLLGIRPTPIDQEFPNPLPELTIDLQNVLLDPAMLKALPRPDQVGITAVYFASESLECAVVLNASEIVMYRLKDLAAEESLPFREAADPEISILEHISRPKDRRFSPFYLLSPQRGSLSAFAMSDVGFSAAAYSDGSLFVLDMRGPKVILRHSIDESTKSSKGKSKHFGRGSRTEDMISCLVWTIGPLANDPRSSLRLIAIYQSGLILIFTLVRGGKPSKWSVEGDPVKSEVYAKPIPNGSFVLSAKTGTPWKADRTRFTAAMQSTSTGGHVLFIATSARGARCCLDITGDRIGKVDWESNAGPIVKTHVIERMGSYALVAFTEAHQALVYSIPNLELMHRFPLPGHPSLPPTVDDTGDFIVWDRSPTAGAIQEAVYGTLFDIRRINTHPEVDFLPAKHGVPAQPQPVSVGPTSILSSWFRFGQSMSGHDLDVLLGGPDRPVPEKPTRSLDAASLAAVVGTTQTNMYEQLTSALNERGQLLENLEEKFNALESGSRSMVAQAKRLAQEQTAKSWLGF